MSEGLTQDDFRRLMATPRRPTEEQEFKAPAPKTPRNAAVFAQPRAMRKKNNFKRKQPEKKQEDDDEEEEEGDKSNYRDRAAERRQQEQDQQQPELEPDQDVDHMLVYQQSKLLGGDIDNTHLVKGLDFALLNKVRSNLLHKEQEPEQETADEEMDDTDLEQVFDKFERGEKITEEEEHEEQVNEPKFHSLMAKNIFELIDQEPKNELFEPGRMAYVFELADEVGHYSDAFHIPTAMIRSKTDVTAKLARSGWSEDTQAESNLIIERISKIMKGKRLDEAKTEIIKKSTAAMTSEPIAMVEDGFMGDIFADAGRDYELDESAISSTTAVQKGSYFDTVDDDEEDVAMQENEQVNALLSKATTNEEQEEEQEQNSAKRRKTTVTDMDADAADIDMFGLSSSALPTSFADHQTTAYQSDDNDDDTIQMVDQGTNRNKKAQLTRWDFDTEEEWQNYKDTIEIQPKSAYQFGVKLGDGRKRNRERKGMNDKQKLNREYQQVKNIMDKKYGKK